MAHGRVWVGVAVLFVSAGTAAAQPVYPGVGSGMMPVAPSPPPVFQSGGPPAFLPTTPPPVADLPGTNIKTLSALADEHPPLKELPSGLPELVPHHDSHHGGEHEIPGYLTPFVPTHGGWFTGAEYMLIRPRDSNADYVIRSSTASGLSTVGPIESLKYNLGSGLRGELGYRYGEGKWETAFAYTYLSDTGTRSATAPIGGVLYPTLTRPGLTDRALTASGHLDLDYMLFDMLVARRVLVDDHFAIRWIGGFRFTDIRETLNAQYDGLDARRAAVANRSQFQGFGPVVGGEAVVAVCNGLHFYSRATAGLITGRNTNRLVETNDNGVTTYANVNYDVRKVVPMGSIAIGGGWQYRTISIRAGYEVTHWQGIFERPRFTDDVGQGKVNTRPSNLTLEGWFLQVGLSF